VIKRNPKNKGKRTSRRRKSRTALRNKADKLFSLAVREKGGWECWICGSTKQITCGHFVSRRYMATRWDFQNCRAECWSCNCRAKYDPLWYEEVIEERYPGRLALLKARARQGIKTVNLEEIVEALSAKMGEAQ